VKVPEQWGDVGEKCSKTIASDAFFTEDVRLNRPHTLINKISKIFNLDDICNWVGNVQLTTTWTRILC